jgi:hypothetical protein
MRVTKWETGLQVSGSGSAVIYLTCYYLESRGEKEEKREQGTT